MIRYGTVRTTASQRVYDVTMDTDGSTVGSDPALKEAMRRLRERLALAEEEEARAHERAESLRIALREVEALAGPAPLPSAPAFTGTEDAKLRDATAATPQGRSTRHPEGTSRWSTAADAIRDLLGEDARPWNATEIISTVERSGALAGLRNPATAVRAALRRMAARGEVVRVGRGYYQTTGTAPHPAPAQVPDSRTWPFFDRLVGGAAADPKEDEP
jgi:hypothetical protein